MVTGSFFCAFISLTYASYFATNLESYTKCSLHFINKNLIFFYGNFTQFFHIFFVDIYQAEYRRRRRQQQVRIQRMLLLLGIALVVIFIFVLGGKLLRWIRGKHLAAADVPAAITKVVENPPDYDVQLLTINDYSRPGLAIDQVNGIVVHYTANPGTTAQQNRDYFEGLKDSHETHASSHFVIGLDGELIQCIPCKEISYASNDRNNDTISIECCIPDDTGRFNDATYQTLVHLVAWLCGRYDLTMDDVIRHMT